MNKNINVTTRAGARLTKDAGAARLQQGHRGGQVRHAQRDVVQSGWTPRDGRIGGSGFEKLDGRGEDGGVDLLGSDVFAMGDRETEGFVKGDRFGQGLDGNRDVIEQGLPSGSGS